ncbi:hypothetical protein CDD83_270 [Cordyceps sp. RAO-2017]|nr:hypothetical protein CDD83_270 [Cordyceps sp. RAO-2017]
MPLRLFRAKVQPAIRIQKRNLTLHEHQSQEMLIQLGMSVPRGRVIYSEKDAIGIINEIGSACRIKVHSSHILHGDDDRLSKTWNVKDTEEGLNVVSQLVKPPTAARGLYISRTLHSARQWHLVMTIDREIHAPVVLISKKADLDFTALTGSNRDEILRFPFARSRGIKPDLVSDMTKKLQLSPGEAQSLKGVLEKMYKVFSKKDATWVEISPLAVEADGKMKSVASRFVFDDAALYRQQDVLNLRSHSQKIAPEVEAKAHGLVYVEMDGNIGTVVNGAGLAMATNDAISFHGGASANFLDAGGKATTKTMLEAFRIILRNERVKAILVNIYGGLTRCDMIAESIFCAADRLDIRVPMVVRLQGTNSEKGLQLLKEINMGLHVESDFGRAAQRVVELANSASDKQKT